MTRVAVCTCYRRVEISSKPARKLLRQQLKSAPLVADKGRARWRVADLESKMGLAARDAISSRPVRALLAGLADHSPFLWGLIEADPERLAAILDGDPTVVIDAALASFAEIDDETDDEAALMRRLRLARQTVALTVALADLGGVWPLENVVQALTRAADAFIAVALTFLLRQAERAGQLQLDADDPMRGCGLAVLALGKLGGRELNYSSDVDLVCLFDPDSPAVVDRAGVQKLWPASCATWCASCRSRPPTATCCASTCGCARNPPPARSPSRCRRRWPITRRSARTGSARRSSRRGPAPATSRSAPRCWPPSRPSSGASTSTSPRSPTSTR